MPSNLLKEILEGRSARVIRTDRWDEEDWQEVLDRVPSVPQTIDELAEIHVGAADLVADEGAILYKANPQLRPKEEVRADRWSHSAIIKALKEDPGYEELQDLCAGDIISTGLTVATWKQKTVEMLERIAPAQEKLDELQKESEKQEELERMLEELLQQPEPDPEAQEQLEQQLEQQRQAVEQLRSAAEGQLEASELALAAYAHQMVKHATEEREAEQTLAQGFGTNPGELKRMPPEERFRLARLLDTPNFRRIADWFGLLKNLRSPHERREPDIPEDLVGVTLGQDLTRVLPDQLALMDDPDLEMVFLKDFASGALAVYEYEGKIESGAGGMVCCIDSSGSMRGENDAIAKAIALNLLNIAKKDKRPFRVIHFDSNIKEQEFVSFSTQEAIDMASTFLGGGTNFQRPLDAALGFLKKELREGDLQSDIVFISDGIAPVPDAWLNNFHAELEKIGGAVWGIGLGYGAVSQEMCNICEGKVVGIDDLTAEGATRDLKKIFDGVSRARKQKGKK